MAQVLHCLALMWQIKMNKYLYFPSCKIIKLDKNILTNKVILYIKSKLDTPNFYPQHPVLKGKAEFLYTIEIEEVENNSVYQREITEIFGGNITRIKSLAKFKKTPLSALIFFDDQANIILDCFAIGKENETCSFFNSMDPAKKELSRLTTLEYKLPTKIGLPEDKPIKI
jgi:hypothetical protein